MLTGAFPFRLSICVGERVFDTFYNRRLCWIFRAIAGWAFVANTLQHGAAISRNANKANHDMEDLASNG